MKILWPWFSGACAAIVFASALQLPALRTLLLAESALIALISFPLYWLDNEVSRA